MPNTVSIKGAAAELRWGYHKAASLVGWTVAGAPGAWTFTATMHDVDDFKVSQRPLMIVTPNGWRWPVQTLQIAGSTFSASITPQK